MALHVLAYNMKRVMHILGVAGLMEAIRALRRAARASCRACPAINIRVFTQPWSKADVKLVNEMSGLTPKADITRCDRYCT
jgi:hypothetical protein